MIMSIRLEESCLGRVENGAELNSWWVFNFLKIKDNVKVAI